MGYHASISRYLLRTLTLLLTTAAVSFPSLAGTTPEEVRFPSPDGLEITADLYAPNGDSAAPLIVLFHQAGWSRGEYREIAPKLNRMGFNCLAVDLRSGSDVNGVSNETHVRAEAKGLGTSYVDALVDIEAAVAYARERHAKGKLLVWGSSYSAALVLKFAGDHPELVDGVLAFAPGEYFVSLGKPEDWIRRSANTIEDPVFITSARKEEAAWWGILESITSNDKTYYLPETPGNHGSRALWEQFEDSAGYWQAVSSFLEKFF